jgi:hypothetical protein
MLKKILIIFGGVLITASLAIFLSFSMLVYQVIYEPEQVGVLKFLVSHIPQTNEAAIFGVINETNFAIHITEPFRLISCLIAITLCLYVLVGIVRVIMMAGIELIKLGASLDETEQELNN